METPKNLFKALSEFQNDVPIIHEGKEGHKYTYSELKDILPIINPLLKKHGLGYKHWSTNNTIFTMVYHIESGESFTSSTEIDKDVILNGMNRFQTIGSAISYFRRYHLAEMLGLVTDKDTDAAGKAKNQNSAKSEITPELLDVWQSQLNNCKTLEDIGALFNKNSKLISNTPELLTLFGNRKKAITNGI